CARSYYDYAHWYFDVW
nr:immunoglobulin heavy chain junction region [Mus musculus]NSM04293.1 immunoglobulin heavy chain junction region [Mus musculus]NSM04635.1 immunoglobulin heavy chain junction region [Mus musculus]NSM04713.1 immunoglobulin heavy chain junction region [Mus musculus]NSM05437.1 immunoglobulin heavy chain junction region [Mus musculus]